MAKPHRSSSEPSFRQAVSKYENWLSQGLIALNQVPADLREHVRTDTRAQREFWFDLLAELDFYDSKILEHVYEAQGGATTLQLLVRHLRQVGIKREALRRRVLMLAHLGLLNVAVRTKPLCIQGHVHLEANVTKLVRGIYQRLGVTDK